MKDHGWLTLEPAKSLHPCWGSGCSFRGRQAAPQTAPELLPWFSLLRNPFEHPPLCSSPPIPPLVPFPVPSAYRPVSPEEQSLGKRKQVPIFLGNQPNKFREGQPQMKGMWDKRTSFRVSRLLELLNCLKKQSLRLSLKPSAEEMFSLRGCQMTLQRPQRLFTQVCTSLLADSLHLVV